MEQKKQVLIIDDDPRNIFALKATLKARNINCLTGRDAAEGIEHLKSGEQIDAVLMDMMMPGLDGYDAIPEIRNIDHRKETPIIAVTAQAMVGDREKCIAAGADDYVSKPINVDLLMDVLNNYFSGND